MSSQPPPPASSSDPDSENYDANNEDSESPSPPSSSSSPLVLYSPPTFWGLLRGAAINLILPFINGLMLGFGELVAHEAAYRLGWGGTRVCTSLYFLTARCACEYKLFDRSRWCIASLICLQLSTDSCRQIFPQHRQSRPVGPGIEIREDIPERKRRSGEEMDELTNLE